MTERDVSPIEKSTMRRVTWRIVPFLMVCYLFAIIDRGNIGMASLQMNQDLGLSKAAFGFASSLFFVSYFLAEVPSNIAMERFGARLWIARIMITWGLLSAATSMVAGETSLYVMRFLLGAAEAGFFPGVLLYLSYWLPAAYRARLVAIFMVSIPAANFIGAPISGALLSMDGLLGLRGWHWIFILEGIPATLLGIACLFVLSDRPEQARWLSDEQRGWLAQRLATENAGKRMVEHTSFWRLARNPMIWAMALIYAGPSATSTTLSVWQPQLIKAFGGLSNFETGVLSALPFGVASLLMVWWGRSSDRSGERRWHSAGPLILIAASIVATFSTLALWPTMVLLSAILVGAYSAKGPFWALSYEMLSPRTVAAGLAMIGATSNLIGGGVTVNIYGFVLERTGSYSLALLPLAGLNLVGAALLLLLTRRGRAQASQPADIA
ncbi:MULTISPECIES: MFS transporter [unclassified Sphingomonas]|jgi:MFS transporter, ACS family, tartrate transporter|nr:MULTISPECIES: MFS transporter [unclassified Sphingomonas]AXJ94917.1 MFS transporter [Sphingomonas sp. FARSPH]